MLPERFNSHKWGFTREGAGTNDESTAWDSLDAFHADLVKAQELDPEFHEFVKTVGSGESWFGCGSMAEFERNLMYGWPELRTQLEAMLSDVELDVPRFPSQTEVRKRKRRRTDHGDTLDITRVWSGDLDHAWEKPQRITRVMPNTKRITLCFELGAHCGIRNSQAMWRAALCMLLVKSLSQAGRTFEIWCQSTTGNCYIGSGPSTFRTGWCVKSAGEPVVMDKLCAMVSVGMLRTNAFMAYNMTPYRPGMGLGTPVNSGLLHGLRKRQKNGEVVLRIGHCFSRQDVLNTYKQSWSEIEAAIKSEEAA